MLPASLRLFDGVSLARCRSDRITQPLITAYHQRTWPTWYSACRSASVGQKMRPPTFPHLGCSHKPCGMIYGGSGRLGTDQGGGKVRFLRGTIDRRFD